jgi:hypothetical protein
LLQQWLIKEKILMVCSPPFEKVGLGGFIKIGRMTTVHLTIIFTNQE